MKRRESGRRVECRFHGVQYLLMDELCCPVCCNLKCGGRYWGAGWSLITESVEKDSSRADSKLSEEDEDAEKLRAKLIELEKGATGKLTGIFEKLDKQVGKQEEEAKRLRESVEEQKKQAHAEVTALFESSSKELTSEASRKRVRGSEGSDNEGPARKR